MDDLALRLRALRDKSGWTVADMAERTGIPKRSLDKYMLRQGASLPGFEALCALSKGLGVPLDWLVFGEDTAGQTVELFTERAASQIVQFFGETLLRYRRKGEVEIVGRDAILKLAPEEWAADLGMRAGEVARDLVAQGVTRQDLLNWKHQRNERLEELLRDRVASITPVGNGN